MPEENQKNYELILIFPPQLEGNDLENIKKEIETTIKQFEGKITFKKQNIQTLAYPINKQRQGVFIISQISISPEKISALSKELKVNNQVLRHLITHIPISANVKKPIKKPFIYEKQTMEPIPIKEEKKIGPEPKEKKPEEEKIRLEEIDKKLDEIIEEI